MNALSIPSLAPVVIVTSVSGLSVLPKNGEYASAMAFFSLGRPYIGCQHICIHDYSHICRRLHTPSWGCIGYTPPGPMLPSPHRLRTGEDCIRFL